MHVAHDFVSRALSLKLVVERRYIAVVVRVIGIGEATMVLYIEKVVSMRDVTLHAIVDTA